MPPSNPSQPNPAQLPPETVRHVAATCLCLFTQRAARVLARRFDTVLRPFGLSNGQFSLLMALNQPQPPTITRLAAFLAMDRTTLTAALKPLERRGLAQVLPDPDDRRNRRLRITPEGVALLTRALPVWRAAHDRIEADLAPLAPQDLRAGLARLAEPPAG